MIYLLYGPDEFARSEALAALKASIPPDLADLNMAGLEGRAPGIIPGLDARSPGMAPGLEARAPGMEAGAPGTDARGSGAVPAAGRGALGWSGGGRSDGRWMGIVASGSSAAGPLGLPCDMSYELVTRVPR